MPHTHGVTVDTEAFELYKNLWNSCGIKNYSYTYRHGNYNHRSNRFNHTP